MKIYTSSFLTIDQQDHTLLQTWSDETLSPEDFMQELQQFLFFYKKVNPKNVIWDNSNFKLDIPASLLNWIENDFLKPQYETGLTSVLLVISSDAIAQVSLMKSMKSEENLKPFYFATKEDAINYLKAPEKKYYLNDVEAASDSVRIVIDTNYRNLEDTIQAVKCIKKIKLFQFQNKFKFNSLTIRESEIFQLVVFGNTAKEIALQLNIQYATVTTHKKNIIKKLELHSFYDWYAYARAFGVLTF